MNQPAKTIEMQCLGRTMYLGALYDARQDKFVSGSLFTDNKKIENIAIKTNQEYMSLKYNFDHSYKKKFEFLDVKASLKVSVLSGMVEVSGSGEYLKKNTNSSRAVQGVLKYTINTVKEDLNIFDKGLRQHISTDALQISTATHYVGGILWGANAFASLEVKNVNKNEKEDIKGKLEFTVKNLKLEVSGDASVDISGDDIEKSQNFSLEVYGDLLNTEQALPQTIKEAAEFIKGFPEQVKKSGDGKGRQLIFTLQPLHEVVSYLGVEIKVDRMIRQLDESLLAMIEDTFESIRESNEPLSDLVNDVKSPAAVCISKENKLKILEFQEKVRVETSKLKRLIAASLVTIRTIKIEDAGKDISKETKMIEDAIANYNEPFSPSKIQEFLDQKRIVQEKVLWFSALHKKNVKYFLQENFDFELNIALEQKPVYIFYFFDFAVSRKTRLFMENYSLLINLLTEEEEHKKGALFFIIETPPKEVKVRIVEHLNGRVKHEDLLDHRSMLSSTSLIKYESELILKKPSNRKELVMRCPNSFRGRCSLQAGQWKCEMCNWFVEYGTEENNESYYYCKCGRAPYEKSTYKCCDTQHGPGFVAFENLNNLRTLIQEMINREVITYLLLGESGVGKSTFINSVNNYINYGTMEMAEKKEILKLVPQSTGEQKPETKVCTSYAFFYGDRTVQLIDTPGVVNPKSTEQDLMSFEAIFKHITETTSKINGVLILLKSNHSEVEVVKFCLQQLLTRFKNSICDNVVFVFTHSGSTNFQTGDISANLQVQLDDLKKSSECEVVFNHNTKYLFENEAFEYLAKIGDRAYNKRYEESWSRSVEECHRLMVHVSALKPYQVMGGVTMNPEEIKNLQYTAFCMLKPVADVVYHIVSTQVDIAESLAKGQTENFTRKQLTVGYPEKPLTVCFSEKCFPIKNFNNSTPSKACHEGCLQLVPSDPSLTYATVGLENCEMIAGGNCKVCGCSWKDHHRRYYTTSLKEVVVDKADAYIYLQRLDIRLKYELDLIRQHASILGFFVDNTLLGNYPYQADVVSIYKTLKSSPVPRHQKEYDFMNTTHVDIVEELTYSYHKLGLRSVDPTEAEERMKKLYALDIYGNLIKSMTQHTRKLRKEECWSNERDRQVVKVQK